MLPGFDANFIGTGIQRGQRGAVIKMDVGHDGDVDGLFNGGHHGGVRRTGHCDADDLAALQRLRALAWATLPAISLTGTFSIVCTAMGLVPPILILPILTSLFS